MHTIMVITAGLALLAAFCLVGRARGGTSGLRRALAAFVPVWAVASVVNLTVGVVSAGYTVMQELPVLLPVFGVPAAVTMLIMWRLRQA
jgi:hypothetical protein